MNSAVLIKGILIDVLQLSGDRDIDANTALLGSIAEFDSMAVVTVLTAIEESFGIEVDDDEITAEVFESFGTLCRFVEQKI